MDQSSRKSVFDGLTQISPSLYLVRYIIVQRTYLPNLFAKKHKTMKYDRCIDGRNYADTTLKHFSLSDLSQYFDTPLLSAAAHLGVR